MDTSQQVLEGLRGLGAKMEAQKTSIDTTLEKFKEETKKFVTEETLTQALEGFKKSWEATGGKPFERRTQFLADKTMPSETRGGRASKELNEIARKFARALNEKNMVELKALSTGVGEDGGFLVPEELGNFIIEKLEIPNHVMTRWTSIPVATTSGRLPAEGAAVTITWAGESSNLAESNPKFKALEWKLNKGTGHSRMSREVFSDSRFPLADWIARVYGKAWREETQNVFINGSGSGQPTGLRFTIPQMAARAQAGANLAATDLINLRRDLAEQYRMNAAWKIDGAVIALIEKLTDTQGRFLYLDGLAPQAPGTLLGLPVLEIPQIPNNLGAGTESLIYLGDTSYYLWFDRGEIAVESTTEGGDAFLKHEVWWKFIQRVDGNLSLSESYVVLTGVK